MPGILLEFLTVFGIALSIAGCAKTKGPELAAGFADTLTIAYLPEGMATFPDFETYRQFPDVVQELGYIDLAVRNADIGSLELGPSEFAKMKALAGDTALDAAALSRLSLTTGKLLLIVGGDYSTYKTAGTRILDALQNTAKVMGAMASTTGGFVKMKETKLHRHAFRAILFDAEAGTVFDTTMVATTESMRGKGDLPSEEPLATRHYLLYVRQARNRGPPGPGLP